MQPCTPIRLSVSLVTVSIISGFRQWMLAKPDTGNVNYSEWYNGTGIHYIEDTDKVMLAFFDLCHKAGPQKCALYASTPIAIQERLESIYTKLQKYPLQVFPTTNNTMELQSLGITRPKVLTYSDVKNSVIYSLYQPLALFSHFAKALAALEADDGIPFLKLAIAQGHIQPSFTCGCDSPECEEESGWPLKAIGNGDAATYVKCGEGEADADKDSLEVMIKYEEELRRKSPLSASVMFNIRLACAGWKSRTKWNFVGEYSYYRSCFSELYILMRISQKGPFEQNTSHPILFIGNSADNITPLASAIHNSHFFPGSSVLVQNSYGVSSSRIVTTSNNPQLTKSSSIRRHPVLPNAQPNIDSRIFKPGFSRQMVRCASRILYPLELKLRVWSHRATGMRMRSWSGRCEN